MFDLFSATTDRLNDSNKTHATNYGAILIALMDKGIITEEEYDRAYIRAQHIISQEFARKRDDAQKGAEPE